MAQYEKFQKSRIRDRKENGKPLKLTKGEAKEHFCIRELKKSALNLTWFESLNNFEKDTKKDSLKLNQNNFNPQGLPIILSHEFFGKFNAKCNCDTCSEFINK